MSFRLTTTALAAALAALLAAPAAAAAATVRVDQDQPGLAWSGDWRHSVLAGTAGSSRAYARATSSSMAIVFEGTAITVIASKEPNAGRMSVMLDGVSKGTVDLYAPSRTNGVKVLTLSDLPEGRHTLRLAVSGTKNAASSGTQVNVDAFDITGRLVPALTLRGVEGTDGRLFYDGPWRDVAATGASGGSVRVTSLTGSSATFEFEGTAATWIAPRGPGYGRAELALDGTKLGTVSMYAPAELQKRVLWARTNLPAGKHTLSIRVLGTKDAASSSTAVAIDGFQVGGVATQSWRRYEETDSRISYGGTWTARSEEKASGGTLLASSAAGSVVRVRFTGTAVRVITPKRAGLGQVEVILDGVERGVFDLHAGSASDRKSVYVASGLSDAEHALTLRVLGTTPFYGTGHVVAVDAVDVRGTLLDAPAANPVQIAEDDDWRLRLAGSWTAVESGAVSDCSHSVASGYGPTAKIEFDGTGIRILGSKGPDMGRARVLLDGEQVAVIDAYSATPRTRTTLWSKGGLAPGRHTVAVVLLGQRDPASTGTKVSIDSVQVTGALVEASRPSTGVRAQDTHARLSWEGAWTGRSATDALKGSHRTSPDPRGRAVLRFAGPEVALIGTRSVRGGQAEVYLDGKKAATVDLYRYRTQYGRVLWRAAGLGPGDHTVVVRVLGTRDARSRGFEASVDAFEVVGELKPALLGVDGRDYRVGYSGPWRTLASSGSGGGSIKTLYTTGKATFTFVGRRLDVRSAVGPTWGKARIRVDGGAAQTVDLYRPAVGLRQRVFSTGELPSGAHSVTIEWAGEKSPASTSTAINVDAVSVTGTLTGATSVARARETIVRTALAQLGDPYVWGADGPSSFDCSGLVMYSYAAAGISLPHYSGYQWQLCSPKNLSMASLLPGDLVFDDSASYIHHVGIYVGDGQTVNAPYTGRTVEFRPASTYGCAGRIKSSLWP